MWFEKDAADERRKVVIHATAVGAIVGALSLIEFVWPFFGGTVGQGATIIVRAVGWLAAFLVLTLGAAAIARKRSPLVLLFAYGLLFPVFMSVWTLAILFVGGAIGPCNTHDPSPAYWRVWFAAPCIATAIVLGLSTRSWMVLGSGCLAGMSTYCWAAYLATSPISSFNGYLAPGAAFIWTGIVGAAMLIWAVRLRTQGIRPAGLCTHCDYDLCGVESSRCPECGRETKPETAGVV